MQLAEVSDASGVVFTLSGVDSDTGLAQYTGTGDWEAPEDQAFIQFLRGELAWDRKGNLITGSSVEYEKTVS